MSKTSLLATVFILAAAPAHAGGQRGSIGVGVEAEVSGLGGPSVNYDAGAFHVGGFLSFSDPGGGRGNLFEVGGRFYYHLHSTAMSDFGVGTGVGLASVPPMGMMGNRQTAIFLEPGFQIRLFLASNVALSITAGLVIATADASGAEISGQVIGAGVSDPRFGLGVNGGAGIHYYFF